MNQNEVSLAIKGQGEDGFPFLRLPREIRNQIYEYLLLVRNTRYIDVRRRLWSHAQRHSRILFVS